MVLLEPVVRGAAAPVLHRLAQLSADGAGHSCRNHSAGCQRHRPCTAWLAHRQPGQRPPGRVPHASKWRRFGSFSVIASTRRPGMGQSSFMPCPMDSAAAVSNTSVRSRYDPREARKSPFGPAEGRPLICGRTRTEDGSAARAEHHRGRLLRAVTVSHAWVSPTGTGNSKAAL